MANFIFYGILWTLALYGLLEIIKTIIYICTYTHFKADGIYVIIATKNQANNIEGFLKNLIFRILYGKDEYVKDIVIADLASKDETREIAKKNGMDKGDNLAFHLIQSFKPGEVDAENAHRLGQQFADEVLKGKYEYVISTHVDKNHIHNHIIFNAASFVDHHKYVSNKRSYHKLCRISNRICHENGLATSMPTGEKGKSYKENMEYHRGTSWKAKLRVAVDKAIWTSINYEEFLQKMQLAGYEVRQGKHLSFRAPEQKNFTYMKSLGSYYSEENVRIRLAKNRSKAKVPKHLSIEARLYINISTYVTTGNREGFERWAKLNNLKEAARTFNYLSENNLLNYEDFQQHVSDVDASVKAADQRTAKAHVTALHDSRIETEARRIVDKLKDLSAPNSPNKTHFMVEISPHFDALASTKDNDRLFAMLPYKSLCFTSIKDRHGVYAMINKDERRDVSIRKPRPSIRKQLADSKQATSPKKAAARTKKNELEV